MKCKLTFLIVATNLCRLEKWWVGVVEVSGLPLNPFGMDTVWNSIRSINKIEFEYKTKGLIGVTVPDLWQQWLEDNKGGKLLGLWGMSCGSKFKILVGKWEILNKNMTTSGLMGQGGSIDLWQWWLKSIKGNKLSEWWEWAPSQNIGAWWRSKTIWIKIWQQMDSWCRAVNRSMAAIAKGHQRWQGVRVADSEHTFSIKEI